MGKKRIAVIGGSYLQLPAVVKAREMGLEVHCFSWADGAVCADYADFFYPVSIIEKDAILEKCRGIGIDAVVTIASDVAVVTVNYVADALGLVSNPKEYTGITTNKYAMRRAFAAHGVPSPRFAIAGKGEMPEAEDFRFPLIVKPTDRSGSRGVQKIEKAEELIPAIERAKRESFSGEAIVEEFAEGREMSVETISFNGIHHLLQITDKVTTGAPYFVELEHRQPAELTGAEREKVWEVTHNALNALHIMNGAGHTELKINASGEIRVIEVGARMGGDFIGSDLVRLSTGYDFLKGVIEVALGEFKKPEIRPVGRSGVKFLSLETAELKPLIENAKENPEIVKAEITDPELRNVSQSADRSGYLIYSQKYSPEEIRKTWKHETGIRLAIVGATDMGIQTLHYAGLDANHRYKPVLFFDDTKTPGDKVEGITVAGGTADMEEAYSRNLFDALFVAIGYRHSRFKQELISRLRGRIPMATIIAPHCYVDPTARLGENVMLYPGCILDKEAVIHDGTTLNLGVTVAHNTTVGECCFMAPGSKVAGFSHVGDRCFIGTGATIIDGVSLGADITVGAGATVIRSLPDPGTYIGTPAVLIAAL